MKQHFGGLDLLINNAGRIYFSSFTEDSMSIDSKIFKVNTFGNVNISRIVMRHWNESQRRGQIVVTSSLASYIELPYMHVYSASGTSGGDVLMKKRICKLIKAKFLPFSLSNITTPFVWSMQSSPSMSPLSCPVL